MPSVRVNGSCCDRLPRAGACVGAGVDLITACDIRYCSAGARFCVKEVDIAIVADMGTLQRLPGIVGQGPALCITGMRALSKATSFDLWQLVYQS